MQLADLQQQIDQRMKATFAKIVVRMAEPAVSTDDTPPGQQQAAAPPETAEKEYTFPDLDDAAFAALGRDNPKLLMALLDAAQAADKAAWQAFQADVQTLKLKRQRLSGQLADVRSMLDDAERAAAKQQGLAAAAPAGGPDHPSEALYCCRPGPPS